MAHSSPVNCVTQEHQDLHSQQQLLSQQPNCDPMFSQTAFASAADYTQTAAPCLTQSQPQTFSPPPAQATFSPVVEQASFPQQDAANFTQAEQGAFTPPQQNQFTQPEPAAFSTPEQQQTFQHQSEQQNLAQSKPSNFGQTEPASFTQPEQSSFTGNEPQNTQTFSPPEEAAFAGASSGAGFTPAPEQQTFSPQQGSPQTFVQPQEYVQQAQTNFVQQEFQSPDFETSFVSGRSADEVPPANNSVEMQIERTIQEMLQKSMEESRSEGQSENQYPQSAMSEPYPPPTETVPRSGREGEGDTDDDSNPPSEVVFNPALHLPQQQGSPEPKQEPSPVQPPVQPPVQQQPAVPEEEPPKPKENQQEQIQRMLGLLNKKPLQTEHIMAMLQLLLETQKSGTKEAEEKKPDLSWLQSQPMDHTPSQPSAMVSLPGMAQTNVTMSLQGSGPSGGGPVPTLTPATPFPPATSTFQQPTSTFQPVSSVQEGEMSTAERSQAEVVENKQSPPSVVDTAQPSSRAEGGSDLLGESKTELANLISSLAPTKTEPVSMSSQGGGMPVCSSTPMLAQGSNLGPQVILVQNMPSGHTNLPIISPQTGTPGPAPPNTGILGGAAHPIIVPAPNLQPKLVAQQVIQPQQPIIQVPKINNASSAGAPQTYLLVSDSKAGNTSATPIFVMQTSPIVSQTATSGGAVNTVSLDSQPRIVTAPDTMATVNMTTGV